MRRVDEAKQWAIGDWLVDGKTHYGDGLYKRASEILGVDNRTLENIKQTSFKFKITLRNVNLSYNHHVAVSSIKKIQFIDNKMSWGNEHDMDKAQEFLIRAEKEAVMQSLASGLLGE